MRASFITPPTWAMRDAENLDGARIVVDRHAERLGDGVGGDVVVGRADAAGGEHVVVAAAQRVERGDDLRLLVGDDAHLLEIDADHGQVFGDVADVLVLGAAGQDLVADDEKPGRDDLVFAVGRIGHRQSSALSVRFS